MMMLRRVLPVFVNNLSNICNNNICNKFQQQSRNLFPFIQNVNSFHSTPIVCESNLAKLRKKTGYAFAMCRKALEMHNQDLAEAEKWLKAEARKQGWAKAEKIKSRSTGEGLIGIYTNESGLAQSTMVEVKCETDFVAKNDKFITLVTNLAKRLDSAAETILPQRDSGELISKVWIVDEKKLAEIAGESIVDAVAALGENIRFVRGCIVRVQKSDPETCLMPYTHAVAGKISSPNPNMILGKYGTIIALHKQEAKQQTEVPESEIDEGTQAASLSEVCQKLGQHIIGLSPTSVSPLEKATIEETEAASVDEAAVGDEEPTALLKQKFIFNDDITVEEFLKNSNTQVLDFVRFECGEELEVN